MTKYICLIVFISIINGISSECPASELLSPCNCKNDSITCDGNEDINLEAIFAQLEESLEENKKHFKRFILSNSAISELVENTFKDIVFDEIKITECSNLSKIDQNTFSKTNLFTKVVIINLNQKLSQTEDNSIFDILSKFVKIEVIKLSDNNITGIPSDAFRPIVGYQDKLKSLKISGLSIKTIGNNAFKNLKSLQNLSITGTAISYIPENAFVFGKSSNLKLTFNLNFNTRFNGSTFARNCFTKLQRPTYLDIYMSLHLNYLDEEVFLPFLMANKENKIVLKYIPFDCDDCRSFWLKSYLNLDERLISLKCSNGNSFIDSKNFRNCDNYFLK